jgi:hypothetical protein
MALDLGDFALVANPPPVDGVGEFYAPRRTMPDKILVDAAVEAGAELRERFSVTEVLTDSERATGIRGRVLGGATVTERACLIIGPMGRTRSWPAPLGRPPTTSGRRLRAGTTPTGAV